MDELMADYRALLDAAYLLTVAMELPGRDLSMDEARSKLMAEVQKGITKYGSR